MSGATRAEAPTARTICRPLAPRSGARRHSADERTDRRWRLARRLPLVAIGSLGACEGALVRVETSGDLGFHSHRAGRGFETTYAPVVPEEVISTALNAAMRSRNRVEITRLMKQRTALQKERASLSK